ncbi:hypothetical protein Barb4_02128 [Bacteroidales bacterium Barb4]|nr:hypothetical protein Barb4_02128 [Bacteroidales bacterium Barb4]
MSSMRLSNHSLVMPSVVQRSKVSKGITSRMMSITS